MNHQTDNSLITNSFLRTYASRDEQVRVEITKEKAIRLIEYKYNTQYDPANRSFDVYDQLLACEAGAESTPIIDKNTSDNKSNGNVNVSVSGNGSVNGGCKFGVNFELNENRLQVISDLKQCNSFTSSFEIADLLEILFREYESKNNHWLWIAQRWTPRAINRSINYLLKLNTKGRIRKNPAACFTNDIKHRSQRKRS